MKHLETFKLYLSVTHTSVKNKIKYFFLKLKKQTNSCYHLTVLNWQTVIILLPGWLSC